MKVIFKICFVLAALLLFSCVNKLEPNEQTIELHYIAWACDCANWATPEDIKKFSDNDGDSLALSSIFIEPASRQVQLPDTIDCNGDIIKLTGRFYKNVGFPKGYSSAEDPKPARVFKYYRYEIIRSNHHDIKTK